MIGLLDVNTLVALFDPEHVHHAGAHEWLAENRTLGWATCPLSENGLIRVISHPKYPGRRTSVEDAVERLARFRDSGTHTFWADSISFCDSGRLSLRHVRGHRQVTDVYLLALAVENGGRLVTFDRSILPETVAGASSRHLEILGAPR
jgi:hypothetical protein